MAADGAGHERSAQQAVDPRSVPFGLDAHDVVYLLSWAATLGRQQALEPDACGAEMPVYQVQLVPV